MVTTKCRQLSQTFFNSILTDDFAVFRGVFRILLSISNEAFLQEWLKFVSCYMLFLISNTFVSKIRLKLEKNKES